MAGHYGPQDPFEKLRREDPNFARWLDEQEQRPKRVRSAPLVDGERVTPPSWIDVTYPYLLGLFVVALILVTLVLAGGGL